jgi:cell wall-associated NlpC family hydrolase
MDVKKYIGIPYVSQSESFEGCECYSICRLFSRTELGVELPDHSQLYADASITKDVQSAFEAWDETLSSDWTEVDEPAIGDVIIFNFYGLPTHVAIYVGNNKCLHATEGVGSYLAELYGSAWERRMKGIMRFGTNS